MFCRATCELMCDRLDGMASVRQIAEMDAHLFLCASCRRHWEALQLLDSRLEQAAELLPSPDFSFMVLAKLDNAKVAPAKSHPAWPYLVAAVVVTVVLSFAALILGGLSSWPVISHPALVSKMGGLLATFVSVLSAVGKALWFGLRLVDRQETGIVAIVSGFAALLLVYTWTRFVGQWWQLGREERAV